MHEIPPDSDHIEHIAKQRGTSELIEGRKALLPPTGTKLILSSWFVQTAKFKFANLTL